MLRSWTIQQAVYGALTEDATLMSLVGGVYDNPPQNTNPPYVTLGDSTSAPDDLLIESGSQETLTIQVWTKDGGMRLVKQIMERIYIALHAKRFVISGTLLVSCVNELAEALREADGETRRGIMRFRISTFG
jgi:hypothetical protein